MNTLFAAFIVSAATLLSPKDFTDHDVQKSEVTLRADLGDSVVQASSQPALPGDGEEVGWISPE